MKKDSITRLMPNKSTFRGFSNDLRFYLVSLNVISKICHPKVRLFFLFAWYACLQNANPNVSDNYFFNHKVRGHSRSLDLYVFEWKHILYRNPVFCIFLFKKIQQFFERLFYKKIFFRQTFSPFVAHVIS